MHQTSGFKKTSFTSIGTGLGFLLALAAQTACVGDKSVVDLNNEQVAENEAKYAVVSGTYTGSLVSPKGGTLGTLSIQLRATRNNVSGGSSAVGQGQAVLAGSLTLVNSSSNFLPFPSSNYDPDSGQFSTSVTVSDPSSASQVVEVNGSLDTAGNFTGYLDVQGFDDYGGQFTLSRTTTATTGQQGGTFASSPIDSFATYVGPVAPLAGFTEPMKLYLAEPALTSAQYFLDQIYPIKTYKATLVLDTRATNIAFVAQLDMRRGTLIGTSTLAYQTGGTSAGSSSGSTTGSTGANAPNSTGSAGAQITFNCQEIQVKGQTGLDCDYLNDGLAGGVAFKGAQFLPAPDPTPTPMPTPTPH
jgi:hypothetical protein